HLHIWSFDPFGRIRISAKQCKKLGLPLKLRVTINPTRYRETWPSRVYKEIYQWQVLRKFDPTTTNFASYLEYSLFEIVGRKSS
ncbi:hypothetical protein L218DRAFT_840774, partial [Marasmius fiardii PR-910]